MYLKNSVKQIGLNDLYQLIWYKFRLFIRISVLHHKLKSKVIELTTYIHLLDYLSG
jgi:hypothetical protein